MGQTLGPYFSFKDKWVGVGRRLREWSTCFMCRSPEVCLLQFQKQPPSTLACCFVSSYNCLKVLADAWTSVEIHWLTPASCFEPRMEQHKRCHLFSSLPALMLYPQPFASSTLHSSFVFLFSYSVKQIWATLSNHIQYIHGQGGSFPHDHRVQFQASWKPHQ